MKIDQKVCDIVANALETLSPRMKEAVVRHNYFITIVKGNTYKLYTDGQLQPQHHTIIDATKRGVVGNIESFNRESIELYDMFQSIERWYRC